MKVIIHVMLKPSVLDPQGEATRLALSAGGFDGVEGVRQGKRFELELADTVTRDQVEAMCSGLLANMVIENYEIEMP